jgi:hypothetical protein
LFKPSVKIKPENRPKAKYTAAGAVFIALSIALTAFGLINAAAVAGGAWFASEQRPRKFSWSR